MKRPALATDERFRFSRLEVSGPFEADREPTGRSSRGLWSAATLKAITPSPASAGSSRLSSAVPPDGVRCRPRWTGWWRRQTSRGPTALPSRFPRACPPPSLPSLLIFSLRFLERGLQQLLVLLPQRLHLLQQSPVLLERIRQLAPRGLPFRPPLGDPLLRPRVPAAPAMRLAPQTDHFDRQRPIRLPPPVDTRPLHGPFRLRRRLHTCRPAITTCCVFTGLGNLSCRSPDLPESPKFTARSNSYPGRTRRR